MTDVIVLGGGISGCACAHRLAHAGFNATLVEKGRGVGGRMATRRMGEARIDHGAQFFTARDPRLKVFLADWENENVVKPWYHSIEGRPDIPTGTRYRGGRGMTSPAKFLAQSFTVEKSFFVEKIVRTDHWSVVERMGQNRVLKADHLVVTFPGPQVIELFDRSEFSLDSDTMDRLEAIKYTRCIALLGLLAGPSSLKHPGTVTHPVADIDWVSDNQIKGISTQPACTVHASDGYSQKHWDSPDEVRAPFLKTVAEETLGTEITEWSCHRWGFAKPLKTFGASHFHSAEHALTLAGDGFGGERIENAFLSGWEAAEEITGNT
jgi:renalase